MRGLLLDSHVALWLLAGQPISPEAADAVRDPQRAVHLSLASVWEIAIKQGLGRLTVPEDYVDRLVAQDVQLLMVQVRHARAVRDLPHEHRDPFDRMLVAQAQVEGLVLVTRDARLTAYGVDVLAA